jgi:hypothetical protein
MCVASIACGGVPQAQVTTQDSAGVGGGASRALVVFTRIADAASLSTAFVARRDHDAIKMALTSRAHPLSFYYSARLLPRIASHMFNVVTLAPMSHDRAATREPRVRRDHQS